MEVISVLNVESSNVVGVYLDKQIALSKHSEDCHVFTSHTLNEESFANNAQIQSSFIHEYIDQLFDQKIKISSNPSMLDNYLIMDACDVMNNGVFLLNSFDTVNFIAKQYHEFNPEEIIFIVNTEKEPLLFYLAKKTMSYDDDDSLEFDKFLSDRNIKIM